MQSLWPNTAAVAAKVIDGEAIIMNLSNGAYYSMDGVGAAVWEAIERGGSREEIQREVSTRFTVDLEQAGVDVDRLLAELLAEGLILSSNDVRSAQPVGRPAPSERRPYGTPMLNKYTEMAELLALDPPMPRLNELPGNHKSAG